VFWLPAIALLGKIPISIQLSSHLYCWGVQSDPRPPFLLISSAKWLTLLLPLKKFEKLNWMKRKKIWREREKNNGKSPGIGWNGKER
jgi:hypothetical protein